jgi:uncharacterized membrane protein
MFAWSLLLWPGAPDRLPVHFDLNGAPDRIGSKLEGLFAMPVVALAVYLLLRVLPRVDPARANYANFRGAYATIRLAVLLVLALVDLAILLPLAGIAVDQAVAMRLIMGGLFATMGAVMGKIRPNWLVGIRTPWTLSSKESWVRTHRLGGWIFRLVGLVFVLTVPLPTAPALVLGFGTLAAGMLWTVVYSYMVWRSDPVRYPATSSRPAE